MSRAIPPLPLECLHGLCLDSLTFSFYRRTEIMPCVPLEISWCFILHGNFLFRVLVFEF
jgi:hypothetical protein